MEPTITASVPRHHLPHPKTGERRRKRQPLRLDRLPLALLDRIRAERAQGRTWDEIERASPQWPEWEQAAPEVLAGFPGRRLPHTNVQRWHDLRVEQLQREHEGTAAAARAFAAQLAAHPILQWTTPLKMPSVNPSFTWRWKTLAEISNRYVMSSAASPGS